ncbi:MAG: hypothetical protein ACYCY2_03380 [Acidithiobacillus ferriphilus]|jgi:hypothetical protein
MRIEEALETARDMLNGTIYDAEQFTVQDCQYIADVLARQGYALRVKPEFSLVYAVPDRTH